MARYTKQEVADARKYLLKILNKGDTIYYTIRHVSASGMQRAIDFYAIKDNRPVYLSGYMARVIGWPMHKQGGIKVDGCGMDMAFHTVDTLSRCLYGQQGGNPGNVLTSERL